MATQGIGGGGGSPGKKTRELMPITSHDLDSSVDIMSERVDVLITALATTNQLLRSVEKSSSSIDSAVQVVMWVVIVQFVLGTIGMIIALSGLATISR